MSRRVDRDKDTYGQYAGKESWILEIHGLVLVVGEKYNLLVVTLNACSLIPQFSPACTTSNVLRNLSTRQGIPDTLESGRIAFPQF